MTQGLPCRDPANDPEDWFIESHGKQYRDDEFPGVNFEAADAEFVRREGTDKPAEDIAQVFKELEAAALKAALIRRRHARDKCFTECPARAACLEMAMEAEDGPGATQDIHGTWGGYYSEQRRELYRARRARRERRQQE